MSFISGSNLFETQRQQIIGHHVKTLKETHAAITAWHTNVSTSKYHHNNQPIHIQPPLFGTLNPNILPTIFLDKNTVHHSDEHGPDIDNSASVHPEGKGKGKEMKEEEHDDIYKEYVKEEPSTLIVIRRDTIKKPKLTLATQRKEQGSPLEGRVGEPSTKPKSTQ
jgi:hypothetical protein